MPVCRTSLVVVVAAACLSAGCGRNSWHPAPPAEGSKTKLKIEYFWSPSDADQHYSSVKTAIKAAQKSDDFQKVKDYVELAENKDSGNQEDAIRLARVFRRSPDVLAVIGHPRSGATLAALPFYAQAGIPVLIPSATSPYLLYKHAVGQVPDFDATKLDTDPPRFTNAFRLPPSDIPDQAHALELTIRRLGEEKHMGRPKVMLICDATGGTRSSTYAKPICDYLSAEAGEAYNFAIVGSRNVDLEKGNVSGVVTEVHAADPDFIALIGYQELARGLLQELKERAARDARLARTSAKNIQRRQIEDYTFIMPDACLTNELLDFGAQIYVTSPMNPRRVGCTSQRAVAYTTALEDIRQKAHAGSVPETDEAFVYDSVLILAAAIEDCNQTRDLNRACVLRYLNRHHSALLGACTSYHVEQGERQNAYYSVYANHGDTKNKDMRPRWFARKEDHELYDSPGWNQPK